MVCLVAIAFAAVHPYASWGQNAPLNPQPATAPPATTETTCFGKKIGKVAFPGASDVDTQMLLKLSGLHEDGVLERTSLQQALRALYGTGRYTDLRAECELDASGNASLTFSNTLRFFVGRVSVVNAPSPLGESQIVNTSKLQLGEPFTSEKLDRAMQNIQRLLQQNGYYKSSLTHAERED